MHVANVKTYVARCIAPSAAKITCHATSAPSVAKVACSTTKTTRAVRSVPGRCTKTAPTHKDLVGANAITALRVSPRGSRNEVLSPIKKKTNSSINDFLC